MSTNNEVSVSSEVERLESERLISESLVAASRDRYASEFGSATEIERMVKCASVKPRTYALPKRLKNKKNGNIFIRKIKKLFGM